jgi:5-methylcytosine-specific restriction protein A
VWVNPGCWFESRPPVLKTDGRPAQIGAVPFPPALPMRRMAQECNQHSTVHRRQFDDRRGSASSRGYDRDWRLIRSVYLGEYPLCADCERKGRNVVAVEVHHIKPVSTHPELRLAWDNLMALCHACHVAITMKEHGRSVVGRG